MNRNPVTTQNSRRRHCRILCTTAMILWTSALQAAAQQSVAAAGDPSGEGRVRSLVSVEPTVLVKKTGRDLSRMVKIVVQNNGEPAEAEIEAAVGSWKRTTSLGQIEQGKTAWQVEIPDIRQPTEATFILQVDGRAQDERTIDLHPARHWKVHFVPITHHDLGYTDTIENVLNRYAGFYDDVLRFCDETADWPEDAKYRYTIEGAWSVQHFLRNRPPDVIARLGKYIKERRIEVGALMGNQISAICGHEEQIRLMYPSFRLQRDYGAEILTGSITDVPGLSWGLPTVMAGAGVKYFFAGLPTYFEWGRNDIHTFWDESAILRKGRPDAFRWEGPDGQKVLVYYQGSYGFFGNVTGPHSYEEVLDRLPGELAELEKKDCPFDVMRYIHNGVDNYPPDVKISQIVRQWNSTWAYPRLVVGTNSMFFKDLEKQCEDVRTFRGELPDTDYVVGAISTANETRINRLAHDRLLAAEKFALMASVFSDFEYPAGKIADAYDSALLYDEHTWGKDYPAGPEQDWGWNEKSNYAYKAAGLAQWVLRRSTEEIVWRMNLPDEGHHVIVFNPLSKQRTDLVTLTKFHIPEPFELIDTDTGKPVAYQVTKLSGPQDPVPYAAYRDARGGFEKHELYDLLFLAEDVPSVGYKIYRIAPKEQPRIRPGKVTVGDNTLENDFYRVTLDSRTGAVAGIYDKQLSRQLVDAEAEDGLNQLVVRQIQTGELHRPKSATIRKGKAGPICASLIVETQGLGCPQVTQEITLYSRLKRIDFANRILKDSTPLLETYFAFPFKVDDPRFRYEGSNSVIEPFRDQLPGSNTNYYSVQHWANVSDGKAAITLSAMDSHLMEFGGIWPCYVSQAHHGVTAPYFGKPFVKPEQVKKGHIYAFVTDSNFRTNFQPVQQTDMLFRYSVTTDKGDCRLDRCHDFGWSVGNPLYPRTMQGKRQKRLDRKMSFCRVDKPNVSVLTIKRAEDNRGVIIRLTETQGRKTEAAVTLPYLSIRKAWHTDLVERDLDSLPSAEHTVTAPIKAFGITTIRVETQ